MMLRQGNLLLLLQTFSTCVIALNLRQIANGSLSGGEITGSLGPNTGTVRYAGVNIAGCDFGCSTDGSCTSPINCPTDGASQMQHFVKADGMNFFRLPVGWQYLLDNQLGGSIDTPFFSTYDKLMQACLATGAKCLIDIHNYARWNGGIIGQGGPTNEQFTSLWTQLAKHYAKNINVVFGIMNEPHDLNMNTWAATVQAAVTAIREAGAKTQMILLPGTVYTNVGPMATESGPSLLQVKNPSGDAEGLVLDVHQYFDPGTQGTGPTCATNAISGSFAPLASFLRTHKRQAFLSETGGGNTASCEQYVCQALQYMNKNSDVYLGWAGWAAGAFPSSYPLSEVPTGGVDTALVKACIAGQFKGGNHQGAVSRRFIA